MPLFSGRSPVDGRGGQLEIAGMVVGRWGPNLSASGGGKGGNSMQPRVMSVGGPRRYAMNILCTVFEKENQLNRG